MKITNSSIIKFFGEAIYLFLIFFFGYTSFNKLINIESFRTNLIKTTIFSVEMANIFSVLIIVLECLVILILFINKKLGLLIFCLTIIIFTLYISYLRFKGLYEVCGCGGVLNGLKYQYHFIINMGLIIGSFLSYSIFKNPVYEK